MRIICGLGNPGKQYELTRHNAGFVVIDKLLKDLGLTLDEEMFNAHFVTYRYKREKILIVEPQTYMNLSGEAISKLMHYYKLKPEDLIVVHDDLDLPVGKIRLRTKGSSAGQKGMGNIIDLLNTEEIKRIRIGIANNKEIDTKDYVLGKIKGEEFKEFDKSCEKAKDALKYFLDEKDFSKVMNKYN